MSTLMRVPRTAAATLTHTFEGMGEDPVAADGGVTVTGVDATGATLFTGAATHGTGDIYTFAMPAQTALAALTVSWAGTFSAVPVVETTQVEIVGGFLFSLAQLRASDSQLTDRAKYSTEALLVARTRTEVECEWICDQAWVPRYRRLVLDGTGTTDLVVPGGGDEVRSGTLLRGVRTLRSATVSSAPGQLGVALTPTQLAAVVVRSDGTLRRGDGVAWIEGDSNVVIEVEVGSDSGPVDLVSEAIHRCRERLFAATSGVPERATSFSINEVGTYRLSLPDAFRTGVPDVDAAYSRYSRRVSPTEAPGGRQVPASRTLNFDPQITSLYHGGRR